MIPVHAGSQKFKRQLVVFRCCVETLRSPFFSGFLELLENHEYFYEVSITIKFEKPWQEA